jgi:hypothetical protein
MAIQVTQSRFSNLFNKPSLSLFCHFSNNDKNIVKKLYKKDKYFVKTMYFCFALWQCSVRCTSRNAQCVDLAQCSVRCTSRNAQCVAPRAMLGALHFAQCSVRCTSRNARCVAPRAMLGALHFAQCSVRCTSRNVYEP